MPSLKNPKADLRNLYNRTFEVSLIVSLALIIFAFKYSPYLASPESIISTTQEIIEIEEIINTVQRPNVPPPPKAPEIIVASINDAIDDFILPDISEYTPIILPPPPPPRNIPEEIPVFVWSEVMPEPLGGIAAIREKVNYTEIAKRIELQGTVYIQAMINKNGDVAEATVLKGLGGGLDEEALNAVKSTKFLPGKQRGRPVNVKMVIPIKFLLK